MPCDIELDRYRVVGTLKFAEHGRKGEKMKGRSNFETPLGDLRIRVVSSRGNPYAECPASGRQSSVRNCDSDVRRAGSSHHVQNAKAAAVHRSAPSLLFERGIPASRIVDCEFDVVEVVLATLPGAAQCSSLASCSVLRPCYAWAPDLHGKQCGIMILNVECQVFGS